MQDWANQSGDIKDSKLVDLDRPISRDEVRRVISAARNGKASGVDGIINEIIKHGGDEMEQALWILFNRIFATESIPSDWTRSLIFPIYKDGDRKDPNNYRGISLLSVVCKMYTSILSQRIASWCDKQHCISEEQAGFREDRSTVDQLFVLTEIIEDRREKKLETHCCFLDIKKAFPSVWRDGMWKRLLDIGIGGKMWRVVRNLYQTVECCVLLGEEKTC